jgi:hypothetical protein
LTKLVIVVHSGNFDLGDKHGFNPLATLHDRWGDALPHLPRLSFE